MSRWHPILPLVVGLLLTATSAIAQADEGMAPPPPPPSEQAERLPLRGADFAGPASTVALLKEETLSGPSYRFAAFDRLLTPWTRWKGRVGDCRGLQFGGGYATLWQHAEGNPAGTDDDAAAGILQLFGRWTAFGRESKAHDQDTLVASTEWRHGYLSRVPGQFAADYGYLGIPGLKFTDGGWLLGDLNWQMRFNGGRTGLLIGRYDPNDYLDILGYANPWSAFQNLAVLLNASIALPDWGTGIGMGICSPDEGGGTVSGASSEASTSTSTESSESMES